MFIFAVLSTIQTLFGYFYNNLTIEFVLLTLILFEVVGLWEIKH